MMVEEIWMWGDKVCKLGFVDCIDEEVVIMVVLVFKYVFFKYVLVEFFVLVVICVVVVFGNILVNIVVIERVIMISLYMVVNLVVFVFFWDVIDDIFSCCCLVKLMMDEMNEVIFVVNGNLEKVCDLIIDMIVVCDFVLDMLLYFVGGYGVFLFGMEKDIIDVFIMKFGGKVLGVLINVF